MSEVSKAENQLKMMKSYHERLIMKNGEEGTNHTIPF